jgi:hypothetical protein
MADIIDFKSRNKTEEATIDNQVAPKNGNLGEVRQTGYINGKKVIIPQTQYEYLMLCKQFLVYDDYMDLCAGILDHDWYNNVMDTKLKSIVDCYYTYKV